MSARVIVIGAGPAGVRCAETLVAAGLRPTVIDEAARAGGQIYRRQPENFSRPYGALYGSEAARAEALHRDFDAVRECIDYLPDTLVWNIAGRELFAVQRERQFAREFDALVLCTGATDRLLPVKGWQHAGTYTLGGAQIALKAQACAIGSRVVFLGSGALLYLVAAQYLAAGATVAALLDTSPWRARLAALPDLLAQPRVLVKGALLEQQLRRARVPLHNGIVPLEIEASAEGGVRGIRFRDAKGLEQRIECDAVALGWHLRPETQLADLAQCDFEFDPETRLWYARRDADGRSSVSGVYLAGDGAAILGANAAEHSGRLAAFAVLKDLGLPVDAGAVAKTRSALAPLQRFARGLRRAFPWPAQLAAGLSDDTVLCRCEAITVGELRASVRESGACEANRAKAFTRVGMGRCQGRYCGPAGAELIACTTRQPLPHAGRLRGPAPVKPLPIALVEEAT